MSRDTLHELVDRIPEAELSAARRFLEYLASSPAYRAALLAPPDDEPVTEGDARAIRKARPDAAVEQRACPLFVPLVEEGWFEHPAAELIATEYLDPLKRCAVDVMVLGCTHYPLLKPLLQRIMGPATRLIDSGEETAAGTHEVRWNGINEQGRHVPSGIYFVKTSQRTGGVEEASVFKLAVTK